MLENGEVGHGGRIGYLDNMAWSNSFHNIVKNGGTFGHIKFISSSSHQGNKSHYLPRVAEF